MAFASYFRAVLIVQIIRQIEDIVPPHCVFASNTSAIPISKLAQASRRPEKVSQFRIYC